MEIVLRLGLFSKTGSYFQEHQVNPQRQVEAPPPYQATNDDRIDQLEDEPLNFSDFNSIPAFLHEDPVLSQYVCPITTTPIRYIVCDLNNGCPHYYERKNILTWLARNNKSPQTNEVLTPDMLQEVPEIQDMIDERLQYFAEKLQQASIQILANAPPAHENQ